MTCPELDLDKISLYLLYGRAYVWVYGSISRSLAGNLLACVLRQSSGEEDVGMEEAWLWELDIGIET